MLHSQSLSDSAKNDFCMSNVAGQKEEAISQFMSDFDLVTMLKRVVLLRPIIAVLSSVIYHISPQ